MSHRRSILVLFFGTIFLTTGAAGPSVACPVNPHWCRRTPHGTWTVTVPPSPVPSQECPCPSTPAVPSMPGAMPGPVDPPTPIVSIHVRVAGAATPGEEIEYHILLENPSAAAAHHVLVRDRLPANARFVRALPKPTRLEPELQWELGTFYSSAKTEIVLVLKSADGGDITNCARVQFEHGQCVTTHIAGRAPPAPHVQPPPPPAKAKLSLKMTGPERQAVDRPAQYLITLTNSGNAPAINLLVANKLPEGTEFVRASQKGQFAAGQVAWVLPALEGGNSQTFEVVLRAKKVGKLCNKIKAVADQGLQATAEFCTLFEGAKALLLEMFDRIDPVPVGGGTSYPILVLNQGQLAVKDIRIKAFVPESMALMQAQGPTDARQGAKSDGYQIMTFEPLSRLEPGARADYEVFVRALRPGAVRFKVEMTADYQTAGPVIEEESTTIFSDAGP